MSWNDTSDIGFASGYYHIGRKGIVTLDEDTPDEIKERFWKVWPEFHAKCVDYLKKGQMDSRYPILPFDDPIENRKHYEK